MVVTDTLFQTKTTEKNIPFGAAHTYIAYIRDFPPRRGGGGVKRVTDYLAANGSETKKRNHFSIHEFISSLATETLDLLWL